MEILLTLVAMIVAFVMLIKWLLKMQRDKKAKIKEAGYDPTQIIKQVKYLHGHPAIDKPAVFDIAFIGGDIHLLDAFCNVKGGISGANITNVVVEDAAEFERRITLARVALIGVFALAFKKRKKVEMAFLTINWSGGKLDNSTIFEYNGTGALQRANTDRNKIIRNI